VGEIADAELAALETQQGATDEDDYSDSSDEEYRPIPRYSPRPHDAEGSSSAAPPQSDPALAAILERMRQDQARQAESTATAIAQLQTRQDQFQQQQQDYQRQQQQLQRDQFEF